MSDKVKFNQNSFGQGLIITGLAELVEKEGLTPHEALDVADMLKNNCFHALCEIKKESVSNAKKEN